jgi:hypothetical protein
MASSVVDPKIDRSFTYDSVNVYYTFKIAHFGASDDLILPTTVFITPEELCTHLADVAKERGIQLESCDRDSPYIWMDFIKKHPVTMQHQIWKYREYVYACSVLFIASYIEKNAASGRITILPSTPRFVPPEFSINQHKFTIVGSAELMSDIDITIQGPRSSFIISLIEDLYQYMSYTVNIPIRCWDVEFYGDFKILQSVFVNMSKFSKYDKTQILLYGLISYFRSSHKKVNEVSPIVLYLVKYCIVNFIEHDKLIDSLIQEAYYKCNSELPDGKFNRELFYRELRDVETKSVLINPFLYTIDNGKIVSDNIGLAKIIHDHDMNSFAFAIFSHIMRGNVHRSESYIVPSTAVHVVEFEQKKGGMFTNSLPESWLSSNSRIGIDRFGFIISAIEQLGYLEHYHPERSVECEKKGIKYFGRLIRALVQAELIPETSTLVSNSVKLNVFRSNKSGKSCEYNVHTLLNELNNILEPTSVLQTQLSVKRLSRTRRNRRRRFV